MAISQAAGTEIIRSATFETVNAEQNLIVGEQHHIYTVLSIIVHARAIESAGNYVQCNMLGYDAKEGTTGQGHIIFHQDMNLTETFVFNDRFVLAGADEIKFYGNTSGCDFDVWCSYIEQRWV